MLHSPFAHNERRKANKAVNGQTKTRRLRVLVVTTIELSGLSARLQFVLSQRPQPHNSDAFFFTFASHCWRAQRISFDASGQRENMNSIHGFVAAN
jgi:hypothetical protein